MLHEVIGYVEKAVPYYDDLIANLADSVFAFFQAESNKILSFSYLGE